MEEPRFVLGVVGWGQGSFQGPTLSPPPYWGLRSQRRAARWPGLGLFSGVPGLLHPRRRGGCPRLGCGAGADWGQALRPGRPGPGPSARTRRGRTALLSALLSALLALLPPSGKSSRGPPPWAWTPAFFPYAWHSILPFSLPQNGLMTRVKLDDVFEEFIAQPVVVGRVGLVEGRWCCQ